MSAGNGVKPRKNPHQKPLARVLSSKGGGALIPGNPGNRGGAKGRSGRKTTEFIEECSHLTDTAVLAKVRVYLKKPSADPSDLSWRWCADYVTGYGKGKPAQSVTVKPDEDAPPFRFTLDLGAAAIHEGDAE